MVFAFSMIPDISIESEIPWIPTLGITAGVIIDPLSILFACLVGFFGFIIILYSLGYMAGEENLTRYYFFLLLFIGSMIGLVMANNFLQFFIFWEMIGLCSYSLISFWNKRPESIKGGIKVFLMTRIGDIFLLAGIALLYNSVGSFSFSYTLAHIESVPIPTLTAVAFLILGGAIAKSAQLPMHTWLYSAMEAPTSISALLHSATMVKAGIYLIARLLVVFGPHVTPLIPCWSSTVLWIGVLTAIIGGSLAVHSPDIKGVQAFSTVSQLGFMMAALGAASSASALGWFASLYHVLSHAFFQGLSFVIIGGIIHAVGTRDMRQMGGLKEDMPTTFKLYIIYLLSAMGIPPFASFFSKELIIGSLWSTGNYVLVLLIYISTALTFAYALRVTILTFMGKKSDYLKQKHVHESPKIMLVVSGILAVLCFAFGFLGPLLSGFMEVEVEWTSEILNPTIIFFVLALLSGGYPVYLLYIKKSKTFTKIKSHLLSRVNPVFEHGYFFDDFYEKVVAQGLIKTSSVIRNHIEVALFSRFPNVIGKGIIKISTGFHAHVESSFFSRFPQVVGNAFVKASDGINKHVETSFFNRVPQIIGNGAIKVSDGLHDHIEKSIFARFPLLIGKATLFLSSKVRIIQKNITLQRLIAAFLMGCILMITILIITVTILT